jgi:hypothetical protein
MISLSVHTTSEAPLFTVIGQVSIKNLYQSAAEIYTILNNW